jgi:Caspase domain
MRLGLFSGLIAAASFAAATPFLCTSALADKRVALVIGNSTYKKVQQLSNPANDAQAVGEIFKAAGFDVIDVRQNLDANGLRRAIRDFSQVVRDADVAVVFYAGHGIELDGNNYLVPIDARLALDIDVEDETISLERVLKIIEPAKRLRLIILDACRDNPFAASMKRTVATRAIGRGLAKVEPMTSDTLIAFAARAGSTAEDGRGPHSPFTTALLKHLPVPGLDVRFAFGRVRDEVWRSTGYKQEPSIYGSLGGDTIAIVPAVPQPPRARVPDADELTWDFLKNSNDAAALKQFVERFPASAFRGEAEARIAVLATKSTGPAADEITWDLVMGSKDADQLRRFVEQFPNSPRKTEAEQRIAALAAETAQQRQRAAPAEVDQRELARLLQLELKRVGCFEGAVDGEFGNATRVALRSFAKFAAITVPDDLSIDSVKAVRGFDRRVCPVVCQPDERVDGERCVRVVCPPGQVVKDGTCVGKVAADPKKPTPGRPEPAPRPPSSNKCFVFQGRQFCE